jgi:hypothetical protein
MDIVKEAKEILTLQNRHEKRSRIEQIGENGRSRMSGNSQRIGHDSLPFKQRSRPI